MLYKIDSMGYFGGVSKVSKGPWFRQFFVQEDGLDYFYKYKNLDGNYMFLLTNNLTVKDREAMGHLYHEMVRTNRMAWFVGGWLGYELCRHDHIIRSWAPGWRFLTVFGAAFFLKSFIMQGYSSYCGPLMGAYFRKYATNAKTDAFDIKDPKKEYFYIDTSEYMNYSNGTLGDEYHCSHGPQPEGEAMDSSYLIEVDKFLKGEPNHLKDHTRFLNYPYTFVDKSFPSADAVKEMMGKTE